MKPGSGHAVWLWTLLLVQVQPAGAAEVDLSRLPVPAAQKVDFAADIKPIFESSCLRCHGPERPKSNFRLTDRASALKGGYNGIDIVSGDSAGSPLIHYVARLVPDMEMPPEGKGTPLSSNQVALLRAWIDQGATWDDAGASAQTAPSFSLSPELSWTSVSGDRSQFRELEWQPEGWNGGAEEFGFQQKWPDGRSVSLEGHALRDDYELSLELRKPDLGYAKVEFEQFRKYYSDAGGYYAGFSPPLYRLGQDLQLDIGKAGLEVGLTLPDWPRIVAGYEYQYKQGSKSMLTWGPVQSPSGNFLDIRNIYPSFKHLDEHAHVLRLDISYDIHGYEFENNLRGEFYSSETRRTDALNVLPGAPAPNLLTQVQEGHHYNQVADAVRFQKQVAEWWLAGAGYRYSWLDGDASFQLAPQDGAGQPAAGSAWSANNILLNETWQVANGYSQFRPLPQLTATLGLQGQWKRQDTFGDVNLDEVLDPADPTSGIIPFPATEQSTLDLSAAEENVLVRCTALPFSTLFAEASLKQEDYTRTADQSSGPHFVQFASDATVRWQDYRIGFNSSPWRRISFGGHYRHRDRETDYDYPLALHDGAYPGFITSRDIVADEVQAQVTFQAAKWLKTTLTYQWVDSDFYTTTTATSPADVGPDATPGGTVVAGRYRAQTINAGATLTPFRRLLLTTSVAYQTSRTTTFDNGSPSVAPYSGDLWSVFANATYVLDDATDAYAGCTYSRARYGQHNEAAGLPLGLDYDRYGVQVGLVRRLSKTVSARIQYACYAYNEPSSANLRDYTAQQVLGVLAVKW